MAIQAQMYSSLAFRGSQDNACGLNHMCFVSQQYNLHQEQQFMQRVPPFLPNNLMDDHQSVAFSQTLSAHVEHQVSEIDLFIHSQNERLRMALQEHREQYILLLIKKYESRFQFLINQKDEEIEKEAKKTTELQGFLKRMEMESQTWERVAREKEAMVASLNSTIERMRETAAANNGADDAESCCFLGEERMEMEGRVECKSCGHREARVIMLPCRHLCSCRECEAFLGCCPVCKTLKKASIEALI